MEDPLMLWQRTQPTSFPTISIRTMGAPSKLSTCCISHTVFTPRTLSWECFLSCPCLYIQIKCSNANPSTKSYTLPSRTCFFFSLFPGAIYCSPILTVGNTYSALQLLICFTQLLGNHKYRIGQLCYTKLFLWFRKNT